MGYNKVLHSARHCAWWQHYPLLPFRLVEVEITNDDDDDDDDSYSTPLSSGCIVLHCIALHDYIGYSGQRP
jgi:hypothetical protein